MPESQVVTRFAPSPTGHLHIGGARTALFNWAFARGHQGRFILRIEDTDRARSSDQSTRAILRDLQWLGIDWDEGPNPDAEDPYPLDAQMGSNGPYFQSQRLERYRHSVDRLLESGRAYKCFRCAQELAAEREQARSEKRQLAYDPEPSRSLTAQQIADLEAQGKPHVVRFAMPPEPIELEDEVLGTVSVQAGQIEDFVILKSDGYPTYHLAVVVDDHEMGVTHVIRGQEHLNNAPKHAALQDALGFERPRYAHIPLIFNPDGSKMSKRDKAKTARAAIKGETDDQVLQRCEADVNQQFWHSASLETFSLDMKNLIEFRKKKTDSPDWCSVIAAGYGITLPEIDVDDFRRSGYLPETVLNYIALLGWSPGDDVERFDRRFLIDRFGLDRVGKSNARFDREKLAAFNGQTLADMAPSDFATLLGDHLRRRHGAFLRVIQDHLELFASVYQPRSQTLEDPYRLGRFLAEDHVESFDPKAAKKFLEKNGGQGYQTLERLKEEVLERCVSNWNVETLEQQVNDWAKENDLPLKQIAQPLRIALSGSTVTPPIYETLVLSGSLRTMQKIDDCLARRTEATP